MGDREALGLSLTIWSRPFGREPRTLGLGQPIIALDTISDAHYGLNVIRSFKDANTQAIAGRDRCRKFPVDVQRRAQAKLMILNNAKRLDDLRAPPGNRLAALSGDRKGQHSIRINDQWRICFAWKQGNAYRVEIVDYH